MLASISQLKNAHRSERFYNILTALRRLIIFPEAIHW